MNAPRPYRRHSCDAGGRHASNRHGLRASRRYVRNWGRACDRGFRGCGASNRCSGLRGKIQSQNVARSGQLRLNRNRDRPRSIGRGPIVQARAAIRSSPIAKCGRRPVRNKCAFLRVAIGPPAQISTVAIVEISRAYCRLRRRKAQIHSARTLREPSGSAIAGGRPVPGKSLRPVRKQRCQSPSHHQHARVPHRSPRYLWSFRCCLIQWPRRQFRKTILKRLIVWLTIRSCWVLCQAGRAKTLAIAHLHLMCNSVRCWRRRNDGGTVFWYHNSLTERAIVRVPFSPPGRWFPCRLPDC